MGSGQEFSVDVDDLDVLVDSGAGYVRALREIDDEVNRARAALVAQLGYGAVGAPSGRC